MDTPPVFHAGEIERQRQSGSAQRLAEHGARVIRPAMPDQHRELFDKLPTLLLAALDAQGWPWATMLGGPPGFVQTPQPTLMRIRSVWTVDDPVLAALRERGPGAPVGVLGLEPHTRRRNRMNGLLGAADAEGLSIEVLQSFGNCPKYIAARLPLPRAPGPADDVLRLRPGLDAAARALIARSDTLFIASASADAQRPGGAEGLDVSHRGGEPGFVQQRMDERGLVLSLPDYPGNQFFNTLGNISLNPRVGLLFVDYEGGGLLQLRAEARILDEPSAARAWPGAQRALQLHVHGGLWRGHVLPWRWTPAEAPPQFQALRAAASDSTQA